MTAVAPRQENYSQPTRPAPTGEARIGSLAWKMLTTTDHKQLGIMYIIMSFSFFFLGGFMALLIRAELFTPGLQFLSNEQFNQLFTMHGTSVPPSCGGSLTTFCHCKSAPPTWHSPG